MLRKIISGVASMAVAVSAMAALTTPAGAAEPVYRILAVNDTSKAITDAGERRLVIRTWHGDANQKWWKISKKGAYFQYKNVQTKQCIAVPSSNPDNGVELITYNCNTDWKDQFWQAVPAPKGQDLQNDQTQKCAAYRNLVDESVVEQQTCSDDTDEEWRIEKV
ncbi:hypothetical protein FHS29_007319 [Saccharothrix tamanrassetensis]|uniref:Ricin B lectin domain-containing protein n=1 Tax=Saccharothrix tamanrassetensis TaxID=1051531 RepID=A0A841CSD5_9PSEU|nr:RICIN domain-containing protein [Saccharothrix tamanrassetensis]MBB5960691.1 hypothetical protein [Saccharothrix tamanrassetensis]